MFKNATLSFFAFVIFLILSIVEGKPTEIIQLGSTAHIQLLNNKKGKYDPFVIKQNVRKRRNILPIGREPISFFSLVSLVKNS